VANESTLSPVARHREGVGHTGEALCPADPQRNPRREFDGASCRFDDGGMAIFVGIVFGLFFLTRAISVFARLRVGWNAPAPDARPSVVATVTTPLLSAGTFVVLFVVVGTSFITAALLGMAAWVIVSGVMMATNQTVRTQAFAARRAQT
jgi:hypothetical protein